MKYILILSLILAGCGFAPPIASSAIDTAVTLCAPNKGIYSMSSHMTYEDKYNVICNSGVIITFIDKGSK